MRLIAIAVVLVLTLAAASCGGDGETPVATQTAPQTVPAIASPSPTSMGLVPPRPSSFEDYPAAVASYLNKRGEASAIGSHCLDLFSAWRMPQGRSLSPGTTHGRVGCHIGNTDEDPEYEVIFSLTAGEPSEPIAAKIAVFDETSNGYQVSYQYSGNDTPIAFLGAWDLNGDGSGDLAFAEITCGAHTCPWRVHVVTGSGSTYRELTPQEGLTLATANVRIEDTDGNGTQEVIMHGGIIESVGAGPQRAQTDVYSWDGTTYSLVSSVEDPA